MSSGRGLPPRHRAAVSVRTPPPPPQPDRPAAGRVFTPCIDAPAAGSYGQRRHPRRAGGLGRGAETAKSKPLQDGLRSPRPNRTVRGAPPTGGGLGGGPSRRRVKLSRMGCDRRCWIVLSGAHPPTGGVGGGLSLGAPPRSLPGPLAPGLGRRSVGAVSRNPPSVESSPERGSSRWG